jgi:putative heme iron utilization protein
MFVHSRVKDRLVIVLKIKEKHIAFKCVCHATVKQTNEALYGKSVLSSKVYSI